MMGMDLPPKCRFRGVEMDLVDARMELSTIELSEVEVTLEDGTVARPFRESDLKFSTDEDGILSF